MLVYLDHIFILAEPATQVEDLSEDAVQEAKKSRVMVGHQNYVTCFKKKTMLLQKYITIFF